MMSSNSDEANTHSKNDNDHDNDHDHHHHQQHERSPLRLYVVGDSLAAGIGTSNSGTPILPESIARSLSKQLGGRPVYWFCHGTNGASANRINSDIQQHFDDSSSNNDPNNKKDKMRALSVTTHFEAFFTEKRLQIVKWKRFLSQWFHKRILSRPVFNIKLQNEISGFDSHTIENSSNTYDVVVVLTGLNDLKGFFPFLANDNCRNHSSFKEELRNIFVTLKDKMKQQIENTSSKVTNKQPDWKNTICRPPQECNETASTRTPMVVIPALPVGLVPLFQYPPLCWFSQLIFDFIDKQKKELSQEYPGQILFVNPPTRNEITDFFKSKNQWQAENVILLLQHVSQQTKKRIEKLMVEYRKMQEKKNERVSDDDFEEMEKNLEESIQHNLCEKEEACIGSSLISIDKVHPNDDGYEFWGRHIAAAIIQEWKVHKS